MSSNSIEKFSVTINELLARIKNYCDLNKVKQEEAIRLTPLLHHSLKECEICGIIRMKLGQPGMLEFENFVYKYAKTDLNFPEMTKVEIEKWDKRQIDWKVRYQTEKSLVA